MVEGINKPTFLKGGFINLFIKIINQKVIMIIKLVPDPGSAPGPQLLESCVLSTHTPTGNFTRGSLYSHHVKE